MALPASACFGATPNQSFNGTAFGSPLIPTLGANSNSGLSDEAATRAAADTQLGRVLDKVGLRVEPGDAAGIVDAVLRLASDPELRSQLGRTGRLFAEETLDQDTILRQFLKQAEEILGERLHAADAERLHKLTGHDRHQGVVALAQKMTMARTITEVVEDVEEAKQKPLFLVLDGVTDPHNFGACLRVADGAGVNAVVIPKDRSASINATVSKVSSGASEVMPVITVTNLVRSMKEMQEAGVWLIGTDDGAEKSIYDID